MRKVLPKHFTDRCKGCNPELDAPPCLDARCLLDDEQILQSVSNVYYIIEVDDTNE